VLVILAVGAFLLKPATEPAPAALALPDPGAVATGNTAGPVEGTWTAGKGSLAGYRVKEDSFGNTPTVVGRTSAVTCTIRVARTEVTAGSCRVDMAAMLTNGKPQTQFAKILDTAAYPAATFSLTKPAVFGTFPPIGRIVTVRAVGSLTIRGITRPVTFSLSVRYTGSVLQAAGSIPVRFSDYNVQSPGVGSILRVQDHGLVEFLLYLHR
jgi:polyisoprenoid-binding protein YceI